MSNSITSPLNAAAASTPAASTIPTSPSSTSQSNNNSASASSGTFLKLLVSQLQHQDPLNPMDSTTFVTQLAQFSQLETLFGVKGDLDSLTVAAGKTPTPTQTFSNGG